MGIKAKLASWRPQLPKRAPKAPKPPKAPKAKRAPKAPQAPVGVLKGARYVALILATVIATAASGTAFAESYRGLFLWAAGHNVPGIWAAAWPLMVDSFVIMGELALFIALVDHWSGLHKVWPWTVVGGGLAVSVAGNMGHAHVVLLADRLTFAVPPLAAFISLTVGLGILKRVVAAAAVVEPAAVEHQGAAAVEPVTAAAVEPTRPRPPSSTAARKPKPKTAAAVPGRAAVAEHVRAGITETTALAELTGLAERTARRYRNEAVAAAAPRRLALAVASGVETDQRVDVPGSASRLGDVGDREVAAGVAPSIG